MSQASLHPEGSVSILTAVIHIDFKDQEVTFKT